MIACIARESTVRRSSDAAPVGDQPVRVVEFRPRTVFRVVAILLATAIVLEIVMISRHVISWIFIALFLTLALNPAVDRLERRIKRRGVATAVVSLAALVGIAGGARLFHPTPLDHGNAFAREGPDYPPRITHRRGGLRAP